MDYTILTPIELKHLKQLRLSSVSYPGPLTCEVVFGDGVSDKVITATFEGVEEFTIKGLHAGSLVGPLKVLDMRTRQLERIKYRVMDFEEERLSFLCYSFSLDG